MILAKCQSIEKLSTELTTLIVVLRRKDLGNVYKLDRNVKILILGWY